MIMNDLIFDVGCNNGDDTDSLSAKGFQVVAIDADRDLCDQVSRRFAAEITAGRCEVICGAVGERTGDLVEFSHLRSAGLKYLRPGVRGEK